MSRLKITGTALLVLLVFTGAGCKKDRETINVVDPVNNIETSLKLQNGTYILLNNNNSLKWTAREIATSQYGTIDIRNGEIIVENGDVTAGDFEIDMLSIEVDSLLNERSNKRLTDHLESADFFAVDDFPAAQLRITEVVPIPKETIGSNALITADLTIKDITNQIIFPATLSRSELGKLIAEATFDIDRTRWDIEYRSGSVFDDIGDAIISDAISFEMNLEFKKK